MKVAPKDPRDIILRPILTEKALNLREHYNQYVFEVPKSATKRAVKRAIETVFGVQVEGVQMMNMKPKPKRTRSRRRMGRTRGWKKAIVKLREGQRITELEAG
ncbi:MAG: 50S ribosomal protein L23 [candidate division WOR-3 bacterium]